MKLFFAKIAVIILNFFIKTNNVRIVNKIYNYSPFIFKDFLKRRLIQPEKLVRWKIRLRNNKIIKVRVNKNVYNEWDFALSYNQHDIGLCIIEQLINECSDKKFTYIDIGANMGLRSLYALSTGRNVIMFEPNIELKSFSENLFKDNNFNNYTIENLCLSDKDGSLPFYISQNTYMSSLNKEYAKKDKSYKEIVVPVTSLDNYMKINPHIIPGIIKIDVEGHEYNVIKGCEHVISSYSPTFLIEILDKTEQNFELLKIFFQKNYQIFGIANSNKLNLIKIDKSLFQNCQPTNYVITKKDEVLEKISKYIVN